MITDYNIVGSSDVIIPSTIVGIPITGIGDYAFRGNSLTTVTIPDSVL